MDKNAQSIPIIDFTLLQNSWRTQNSKWPWLSNYIFRPFFTSSIHQRPTYENLFPQNYIHIAVHATITPLSALTNDSGTPNAQSQLNTTMRTTSSRTKTKIECTPTTRSTTRQTAGSPTVQTTSSHARTTCMTLAEVCKYVCMCMLINNPQTSSNGFFLSHSIVNFIIKLLPDTLLGLGFALCAQLNTVSTLFGCITMGIYFQLSRSRPFYGSAERRELEKSSLGQSRLNLLARFDSLSCLMRPGVSQKV